MPIADINNALNGADFRPSDFEVGPDDISLKRNAEGAVTIPGLDVSNATGGGSNANAVGFDEATEVLTIGNDNGTQAVGQLTGVVTKQNLATADVTAVSVFGRPVTGLTISIS